MLFEAAPASYVVLDPQELVIIAVSDAFQRDTMTTAEQVLGRVIFDAFPDNPDDAGATGAANLRASLERVVRDRVPDTMAVLKYDIQQPAAAGGEFEARYWSQVNSPIIGPDGRLACILIHTQDVTEYIRLKEQETEHRVLTTRLQERTERMEAAIVARSRELQEANRALRAADTAKNEFLSRGSHELRTPLNAILGFGELLSLGDITAEHRDWVTMILAAGRDLLCVLDEMLDISLIESGRLTLSLERVSAHRVIADALDLVRPLAESCRVRLDPVPAARASQHVQADYRRLRQILLNLLSNAVKFNRPDGTVAVAVQPRAGGRLRISVSDTGHGISQQAIGKLFTPFERLEAARSRVEGTGLGLALCRELVEAMGGDINVSSVEGRGSTFWVELPEAAALPVAEAEPAPAEPRAAARHADNATAMRAYTAAKTVLYVEDVEANMVLVERILRRRPSITIVPTEFGGAGLELAREWHPDLILLDVHLPDMTGDEVVRRLQASPATSGIPIVILSADATQHQIDRLLAAGAAAYLTKPINVRQFLQAVDNALDQSQPSTQAPSAKVPSLG